MSFGSNQFGSVMYGESATVAPSILVGQGIQITINGELVDYAINSYRRSDNLENRGSASFKFFDKPPDYPGSTYQVGHRVAVTFDEVTLFRGTVDEIRREIPISENPATPRVVLYDCKAVDHFQLLDRFLIFAQFERDLVDVTVEWSGGLATVTETEHEYTTGDSVEIAEADDADLNGRHEVTVTGANSYSFVVGNPFLVTTPANAKARRFYNVIDAVNRIVNELTPLKQEGVTTGGVVTNRQLVIPGLVFDRQTAKQALERIASFYELVTFIDNDKVLHMTSTQAFHAPFGFGEDDKGYSSFIVKENRKDYRNVQYLSGGKAEISVRTEDHKVTDDEKTVELQFGVAQRPKIEESTDAGVTFNTVPPARIGIRDSDDEDLTDPPDKDKKFVYRWFWRREAETLSFNNNITADSDDLDGQTFGKLDNGDVIRVTYVGLADVLTRADDVTEQNSRAAIEGGSGIYEKSQGENEIEDTDTGAELGEALLRRHGRIPRKVEIGTFTRGLQAGQTITLDFPRVGVTGPHLITTVSESDLQGNASTLKYQIKCELIQRPRSLFDFWKEAVRDKEVDIRQPGQRKLNTLRKGSEQFTVLEVSFAAVTADEVEPIANDFGTIARMGLAKMGTIFMEAQPERTSPPVVPAELIGGVVIRRVIGPGMVGRPSRPA